MFIVLADNYRLCTERNGSPEGRSSFGRVKGQSPLWEFEGKALKKKHIRSEEI